ncbi:YafY family protein [Rhodocytophaga aerolata]|uniref:YafY family protein n=1 Tax=Rhodocytophaga aerolata TaxID=455078 RepID=A0ABT8RAX4_9BACT|nr:YafY family protein [Rhodocytophaga aerolata]MDO1447897.1 YafY family protein [Rhodocytophaga aerolata]
MNRIDRLTAILIQLQTKKVVKAQEIADRFNISLRTVYRDIRALEEAGVPIGAEAGIGYFLENYHLPPVMFTTEEASALLLGAKLIEKMSDQSINKEFNSALYKIKSVLKSADKEHVEDLENRVQVLKPVKSQVFSNDFLTTIQQAIVKKCTLLLEYFSYYNEATTKREVDPIGISYYGEGWHLIAFCHLRQDYRDFRADRIIQLTNTGRMYKTQHLSLQHYFQQYGTPQNLEEVVILFDQQMCRFLGEQKHLYGYQSEERQGEKVRVVFNTAYLQSMGRWLLSYGNAVQIEKPERLKDIMIDLASEVQSHYLHQEVENL